MILSSPISLAAKGLYISACILTSTAIVIYFGDLGIEADQVAQYPDLYRRSTGRIYPSTIKT
jgi:hypothetical protein